MQRCDFSYFIKSKCQAIGIDMNGTNENVRWWWRCGWRHGCPIWRQHTHTHTHTHNGRWQMNESSRFIWIIKCAFQSGFLDGSWWSPSAEWSLWWEALCNKTPRFVLSFNMSPICRTSEKFSHFVYLLWANGTTEWAYCWWFFLERGWQSGGWPEHWQMFGFVLAIDEWTSWDWRLSIVVRRS